MITDYHIHRRKNNKDQKHLLWTTQTLFLEERMLKERTKIF